MATRLVAGPSGHSRDPPRVIQLHRQEPTGKRRSTYARAIWYTEDGFPVYVLPSSNLNKTSFPYCQEAVAHIQAQGRAIVRATVDFAGLQLKLMKDVRVLLGRSQVVKTTKKDHIVWGKLFPMAKGHSRFALYRQGEMTSKLSVVLRGRTDFPGSYVIVSSWFGDDILPEPWRSAAAILPELEVSLAFWETHAYAGANQAFVPGSFRKDCPWENVKNDIDVIKAVLCRDDAAQLPE